MRVERRPKHLPMIIYSAGYYDINWLPNARSSLDLTLAIVITLIRLQQLASGAS